EPATALDLVEHHFGGIARAPASLPEVRTREPEQQGERRVTIRQPGQLGMLMMAYKQPPALDADADALDVLAMGLGYGKTSRLYRRLTDAGLTAQVFASASRNRDASLFYVFAALAPGRTHAE